MKTINKTFLPLSAEYDKKLFQNADRGYRTEMLFNIRSKCPEEKRNDPDWRTIYIEDGISANREKIIKLINLYIPVSMSYRSSLVLVFIDFSEYGKCKKIPQDAINLIRMFFDLCRALHIKILWRHSYGPPHVNYILSDENKELLAKKCADLDTMISHIDQLAPLMKEYSDVIHKFSSGFIGNGEMTECWQWPQIDTNILIKNIIEKWCIPNGIYYTVRLPLFKLRLAEAEPDYPYLNRIGYNNDAIFGEQERPNWESGCFQYNHNHSAEEIGCLEKSNHVPNDWWQYVKDTAAATPQSGEMFTNFSLFNTNRIPIGIEVIKELAHHRYTSFSQWHTLYQNPTSDNVIRRWIENETVTTELLDSEGIIYDPAWFKDSDGNVVKRNPYQYIRDHLGYKLVAQNACFESNSGQGRSLKVSLNLKNYGFAAAFMMKSGFAVLNDKYEVVSSVEAGNPESWISLPADYYSVEHKQSVQNDVLTHTVSTELTLPEKPGTYYIAFYLKNSLNDYAALSNDQSSIHFVGEGYNVLHKIEI